MKSSVSAKSSKSFLVLLIGFIMLCSPFLIRAQSAAGNIADLADFMQPVSTELANVYEGKVLPLSPGTIRTLYIFEKPSKAIVRKIIDIPAQNTNQMLFNAATGRMELMPVLIPASSKIDNFVGTYTQRGNKIRVVAANATIEATIVDDGLEGMVMWNNGDKEDWTAIKISDDTDSGSSNSSSKNSPHPNTVVNADGTLRPAKGYRWINPKDSKDFRVERIP